MGRDRTAPTWREELGVSEGASPSTLRDAFVTKCEDAQRTAETPAALDEAVRKFSEALETLASPNRRGFYDDAEDVAHASHLRLPVSDGVEGEGWQGWLPPRGPATPDDGEGDDVHATVEVPWSAVLRGDVRGVKISRRVPCPSCASSVARTRPCPQCRGRGAGAIPSQIFLLAQKCAHCAGTGKAPVARRCATCGGGGITMEERTVHVNVPCGATGATRIVVPGAGHTRADGRSRGRLVVHVWPSEDRRWTRVGKDIHIAHPIPMTMAILGGYTRVPSPWGSNVTLPISPGVNSGDILTIHGHGLPMEGSPPRSDDGDDDGKSLTRGALRVHIVVVIPTGDTLTGRQKNALREYDAATDPAPLTDDERAALRGALAALLRRPPA